MKVLHLDDDTCILDALALKFKRFPLVLTQVSTLEQALEALSQEFDLFISDWSLGGCTARDAVNKALEEHIPTVIFSAIPPTDMCVATICKGDSAKLMQLVSETIKDEKRWQDNGSKPGDSLVK